MTACLTALILIGRWYLGWRDCDSCATIVPLNSHNTCAIGDVLRGSKLSAASSEDLVSRPL